MQVSMGVIGWIMLQRWVQAVFSRSTVINRPFQSISLESDFGWIRTHEVSRLSVKWI